MIYRCMLMEAPLAAADRHMLRGFECSTRDHSLPRPFGVACDWIGSRSDGPRHVSKDDRHRGGSTLMADHGVAVGASAGSAPSRRPLRPARPRYDAGRAHSAANGCREESADSEAEAMECEPEPAPARPEAPSAPAAVASSRELPALISRRSTSGRRRPPHLRVGGARLERERARTHAPHGRAVEVACDSRVAVGLLVRSLHGVPPR
jgi:hypothetical protein